MLRLRTRLEWQEREGHRPCRNRRRVAPALDLPDAFAAYDCRSTIVTSRSSTTRGLIGAKALCFPHEQNIVGRLANLGQRGFGESLPVRALLHKRILYSSGREPRPSSTLPATYYTALTCRAAPPLQPLRLAVFRPAAAWKILPMKRGAGGILGCVFLCEPGKLR